MFGSVFGGYYGDADKAELDLTAETMMQRVKWGAGMGMATFKDEKEEVLNEEGDEISSLAGEPVPPSVMAAFLKARRPNDKDKTP